MEDTHGKKLSSEDRVRELEEIRAIEQITCDRLLYEQSVS